METNLIYNEDCFATMGEHIEPNSVDIVLTSPPYCTSVRAGKGSKATLKTETHSNPKYYPSCRYDVFNDNMTPEEYVNWTVKLFKAFDGILRENGCILYNISYSSTRRDMLFSTIAAIVERTDFSLMDMIIWKKNSALPNNTSSNKLTRIVEPVFVFARREESDTFICNKKVASVRERTGQKMYENVFNFIEAANNDGANDLNKATYSSELCEKLLNIYGRSGMTVYDPFMGTGTTGVACKRLGMQWLGSELSPAQTEFATKRIAEDDGVPRVDPDAEQNAKKAKKRRSRGAKDGKPQTDGCQTSVCETPVSETPVAESPFRQTEMFTSEGDVGPDITGGKSVENADSAGNEAETDIPTVAESENESAKPADGVHDDGFSSTPLTAAETEICDEFSDVDSETARRMSGDASKAPTEPGCPVDEDEFE